MMEQRTDEEPAQGEGAGRDGAGRVTFWTVVGSTLAAAIGVQSSRNKERDFQHGSAGPFIAAGIIFTVLFVITLIVVVRLVLSNVG